MKTVTSFPVIIVGFVILIVLGIGFYFFSNHQRISSVKDFESCAKNYPVLNSYPAQCNTPDGRHFVQPISEDEKKKTASESALANTASSPVSRTSAVERCLSDSQTSKLKFTPGILIIGFEDGTAKEEELNLLKDNGLVLGKEMRKNVLWVKGVPVGKEWEYKCKITGMDKVRYVDLNLQVGTN